MTSTGASTAPTKLNVGRYIGEVYGTGTPAVKGRMPMWRDSKNGPVLADTECWVSQYNTWWAGRFESWDDYLAWLIESNY